MSLGTIYGVALNDREEAAARATEFTGAPYTAPPVAPVLYVKPMTCLASGGAPVPIPQDAGDVVAAATVALLIGVGGAPSAACIAADIREANLSYYRPPIRGLSRDGFLPVGAWAPVPTDLERIELVTFLDDGVAHRWSLDRLVRSATTLLRDVGAFMTLDPGDVMLLGTPGDAPVVRPGERIRIEAGGLPALDTRAIAEAVA